MVHNGAGYFGIEDMRSAMEKILEIKELTRSFGNKVVVDHISFDVNSGEICGFLGPNGSGKTTTIKMIAGMLFPDSGTIRVCGHDVEKDFEEAMANVGGIVENPDSYGDFSGRMNLELAAKVRGVSEKRIDEVIRIVGLENRINEKVKRYSLGMKQRLGIAHALLSEPRFLMFDEPTNGLDPAGIRDFRRTIKRLAHEEGIGVLVSSHMMSEMELLCDKVVIIEKGKLMGISDIDLFKNGAAEGDVMQYKLVVSSADDARRIITEKLGDVVRDVNRKARSSKELWEVDIDVEEDDIPMLVKALVCEDVEVWMVEPMGVSLEDAYINATGGGAIG